MLSTFGLGEERSIVSIQRETEEKLQEIANDLKEKGVKRRSVSLEDLQLPKLLMLQKKSKLQ